MRIILDIPMNFNQYGNDFKMNVPLIEDRVKIDL